MGTTSDIKQLLAALKAGQCAIFPTDTVVGLGVAPAYAQSPQAIFAAKQRDAGKPVAWLVGGVDALDVYGTQVPDYARNMAHAFWPGALTLVVHASDEVPASFQAPDGSIALRMPAHTRCLEIIHQVGPLATSSANRSGEAAPARVADVDDKLMLSVGCVFDDGTSAAGQPSTIVDCRQATPIILRQGSVVV
ncbi:MAG: threonylcarbamoyl-AMP synthase [Eggerthellaceae bacterium]|nr:threonylcarbamoyl-AMP synthase [Eggerthellaceae bacterium]